MAAGVLREAVILGAVVAASAIPVVGPFIVGAYFAWQAYEGAKVVYSGVQDVFHDDPDYLGGGLKIGLGTAQVVGSLFGLGRVVKASATPLLKRLASTLGADDALPSAPPKTTKPNFGCFVAGTEVAGKFPIQAPPAPAEDVTERAANGPIQTPATPSEAVLVTKVTGWNPWYVTVAAVVLAGGTIAALRDRKRQKPKDQEVDDMFTSDGDDVPMGLDLDEIDELADRRSHLKLDDSDRRGNPSTWLSASVFSEYDDLMNECVQTSERTTVAPSLATMKRQASCEVRRQVTSETIDELQSPASSKVRIRSAAIFLLSVTLTGCLIWMGSPKATEATAPAVASTPALPDSPTQFTNTKPIEQIVAGDMVYARDENTGAIALKKVLRVFHKKADHVRHLTIRPADGGDGVCRLARKNPIGAGQPTLRIHAIADCAVIAGKTMEYAGENVGIPRRDASLYQSAVGELAASRAWVF